MSQIDNARAWLGGAFHCEFRKYIETVLAGDFACALVELFERKDRLVEQQAARIAELEASKAAADDMFRSLGGEIYELNAKLAALKAQQAALIVRLEERIDGLLADVDEWQKVAEQRAQMVFPLKARIAELEQQRGGVVDERAAFEAAFENTFFSSCFERDEVGSYAGRGLNGAWMGWQARARLNPPGKFRLRDSVRKTKGSQWSGRVVGFYSTEQTPDGYAVESFTEKGSVQIYPGSALEPCEEPGECVAVPEDLRVEAEGCAFVLENIGGMDAEDVNGDDVDLWFEDAEGRDTGCDVSIVEYAERGAKVIRALLAQQGKEVGDE